MTAPGESETDLANMRPPRVGVLDDPRVLGWGSIAIFLLAWEVIALITGVQALYLPRPSQIILSLFGLFRHGGLLTDLLATLGRIFGGFFIALFFGVLLGIWIATSNRVRAIADTFIAALYPLPKITLIPLLIIWLGTGGPFMLTISGLGAIFPIVINTVLGVRQSDPGLVLAARDLGASPQQIVRMVLLPSAIPSIFAGVRLGLGV
jgi:NitT/TauT family transport system permease protein